MIIKLLFGLLVGLFFCCQANDEKFFFQGQSLIKEAPLKLPSDVNTVPGYRDPTAFGQSISENNIDQAAQNASQESQEASLLRQTYTTRSRFDLDEKADPLFTDADEVISNPEKKMNLEASTRTFKVGTSQHTCTKGYDLLERKCKWWPVTEKTGMSQEVKTEVIYIHNHEKNRMADTTFRQAQNAPTTYLSSGIHLFKKYYTGKDALSGNTILINTNRILSFRLLTTKTGHYSTWEFSSSDNNDWFQESWWSYPEFIQLEVKHLVDVPVYTLTWQNDCDDLEGLADTGACEYSEKKCIEGEGTRFIEGTPVHSKCWREEAIYQCRSREEDTCQDLAKRGCFQIGSKCLSTLEEGHCIKWQQTYECQSGKRQASLTTLHGDKPFCLDGTCLDQSWDGNPDMIEALSKLAIFKEMQKGLDAKAGIVFKGENFGCSRIIAGFKDCCQLKGWGKNLGLTNCDENADKLALARKQNKCVRVGTYCAERKAGLCFRRKTTYCCYPSKLAKLINVQGKQQLGLSFGSAEHPDCEGLTLAQINQIDFSKLDLSELFSEIFEGLKTPNNQSIGQDIQKSLTQKTYMINDKQKKITQGRAHGNF